MQEQVTTPDQTPSPMVFNLSAHRVDSHGSEVTSKETTLTIDTSMTGRLDALNPVELLLASLAACMIKGIERVTPSLNFEYTGVNIKLTAVRPALEARIDSIDYEIMVETNEPDRRLALLHENVKKFGTIFNTVSAGTKLQGVLTKI